MKSRYWFVSTFLLFLTCSYLFYFFYESERAREIKEIVGHQKIHAKQAAKNFSELLEKWNSVLFYLSKDPNVVLMNDSGKYELDNLRKVLKDEINGITRVNKSGIIIFSTPYYPNTVGRDISKQKHMIKILSDHLPVVSDVFESVQGYQAIVIHYPVYKNNKFFGTIAFLLNFRQICKKILDVTKTGNSVTLMLNSDGKELYSSRDEQLGKSFKGRSNQSPGFSALIDSMLQSGEGSFYFSDKSPGENNNGSRKIAYYIPVKVDHGFWSIALIYSEDDITAALYSFRNKLILIFGLIFLGGIVISYFGIKAWIIVKETDLKKNAEKELRKSEEKYRLISSVASDYMFSSSLDGKGNLHLDWVSGAFEMITEYTYEEYIEIGGWRAALHPEDKDQDERDMALLQVNQHVITEVRTLTKSGKIIWVRVYAHPIWNKTENRLVGIYGAVQNITERKTAEEELRKSEERFKTIFNSVNDGIIIHHLDTGEILDVNDTMVKLYGYTKAEFLNLSINDISLGIVPYSQNEAIRWITIVKEEGPRSFEWMAKHKSGKIFWVEVSMSHIRLGGTKRLLAMVRDISERKSAQEKLSSSEARYRNLFEHNPAPMMIYERGSLQILAVNEAFQLHYGYTPDEITKMILTDLYPVNEKAAVAEITQKLYGYKNVGEWHHIKRDGSLITIIVRSHDFDFENHSARVAVITDISELKKAEQVLIEAKENAERSERLKSNFLAQMSHEIRSPVNNILNFSELIRDNLDPKIVSEFSESFNAVEQAGSRIVRTIDLILNMSELQTGNYVSKFEKLYLNDLLEIIYNEYKFKAENKNIDLRFMPDEKKLAVFCDEYSTVQIFVNLIDNAIKYTNKGSVEISVSANRDNKALVKFEDTGIGISEEYLENIFTPFSQEEQGYTRRFEGNGLGLALVKKYCEINNAEIEVESVKGKGSTFTVVFDLVG